MSLHSVPTPTMKCNTVHYRHLPVLSVSHIHLHLALASQPLPPSHGTEADKDATPASDSSLLSARSHSSLAEPRHSVAHTGRHLLANYGIRPEQDTFAIQPTTRVHMQECVLACRGSLIRALAVQLYMLAQTHA